MYMLVGKPIDTHKDFHRPAKTIHVAKVHDRIGPAGSMRLYNDSSLRTYVYNFEGMAAYKGQPCANASVLVRVVTSRGTFVQGGITEADGRYAIKIIVDGNRFEPVDWSMEAHTSDSKKAQLVGSRIMMHEDEDTTVRGTLDFQLTSDSQQPS